jgi:chromate transporter
LKLLGQLFINFFIIGLFTIGGGLAMLPFIQRMVVDKKRWLSEAEMLDCIAIAQSLPGVLAINTATYVGNRKAGFLGALAATMGVILPSFIIIILLVVLLGTIGENSYIEGAFTGIKAAASGLILYSAIKLGKGVVKGWFPWLLAILSFIIIVAFNVSAILVILGGALLGTIYFLLTTGLKEIRIEKNLAKEKSAQEQKIYDKSKSAEVEKPAEDQKPNKGNCKNADLNAHKKGGGKE